MFDPVACVTLARTALSIPSCIATNPAYYKLEKREAKAEKGREKEGKVETKV